MKITKRDKVIDYLTKKGSKELPCRSSKYRQFTKPEKEGIFYFVGKKGALRTGRCSSKSISLTRWIERELI